MTELFVRNYWLSGPFFRQGDGSNAGAGDPNVPGSPAPTPAPTPGGQPPAPGGAADPGRAPASGTTDPPAPGQADEGTPAVEELLRQNREYVEELKALKTAQGRLGREVGPMRLLKRQIAGEILTPSEIAQVNEIRGVFAEPVLPGSPAVPPASPPVPGTVPPTPVASDPKIVELEGVISGLQSQVTSMSQNIGNLAETTTDFHADQRIAKDFSPEERKAYQPHVDVATRQIIAKTISMEEVMLHHARSKNLPAIIVAAEKRGAANYAAKLQKNIDDGIPTSGGVQPIIPGASGDVKVASAEKLLRITDPVTAEAVYGKEKAPEPAPASPPAT